MNISHQSDGPFPDAVGEFCVFSWFPMKHEQDADAVLELLYLLGFFLGDLSPHWRDEPKP